MDKDHKYDKYEEKATDFARGQYEKSSGKPVNPKVGQRLWNNEVQANTRNQFSN
jgi:hypothetical protein